MRAYGNMALDFWTRGTGRRLVKNKDARWLAVYLMSAPTSLMTGVYPLPMAAIERDLDIPREAIRAAFDALAGERFAFYDETDELVWVPNLPRDQVAEELRRDDKRRTGFMRQLQAYGTHPFARAAADLYREAYSLGEWSPEGPTSTRMRVVSPFDGASKPLRSPFEGPSNPLRSPFEAPSKPLQENQPDGNIPSRVSPEAPSKPLRSPFEAPLKPVSGSGSGTRSDPPPVGGGCGGTAETATPTTATAEPSEVKGSELDRTSSTDEPDPWGLTPVPAAPPTKPSSSKAKRPTRLDPDWRPSPATIERFRSKEKVDAEASFERFQNFWLSKSGASSTKADWERTFVNWVLEDIARGRAAPARPRPAPPREAELPSPQEAVYVPTSEELEALSALFDRRPAGLAAGGASR